MVKIVANLELSLENITYIINDKFRKHSWYFAFRNIAYFSPFSIFFTKNASNHIISNVSFFRTKVCLLGKKILVVRFTRHTHCLIEITSLLIWILHRETPKQKMKAQIWKCKWAYLSVALKIKKNYYFFFTSFNFCFTLCCSSSSVKAVVMLQFI